MRYIITHKAATDAEKLVYMVTFAAMLADSKAEAISHFQEQHPDRIALDATPAPENEGEAFIRYGTGAMTDEEREAHRARMKELRKAEAKEHEAARESVGAYSPQEFYAEQEYQTRRDSTLTQNADGVHVGDIFVACWGYDQTNYDFYQVVALKGKRTAIVRENSKRSEMCGDMTGYVRPIRDSFKDETTYTLRTKTGWYPWYGDNKNVGPEMNVPGLSGHHTMGLIEFGKLYHFTAYA